MKLNHLCQSSFMGHYFQCKTTSISNRFSSKSMSKDFVTINHFLVIFNELKIHVPVKEIHVQLTSRKRKKSKDFFSGKSSLFYTVEKFKGTKDRFLSLTEISIRKICHLLLFRLWTIWSSGYFNVVCNAKALKDKLEGAFQGRILGIH